jgi:hypothetical protein
MVTMGRHFQLAIGVALILAVLTIFISSGVPMPKSVLSGKQRATFFSMYFSVTTGILALAMVLFQLSPDERFQPSGTELINRLCSRIC